MPEFTPSSLSKTEADALYLASANLDSALARITALEAAVATQPKYRIYGVLQPDATKHVEDYAAGIRLRSLEIGWDAYEPTQGAFSTSYRDTQLAKILAMKNAGFQVILDLGTQYPATWAKNIKPWIDQYGNVYNGQVNSVWSASVRSAMESYITRVFSDLGTDFWGVRLGSGAGPETLYPGTVGAFSYWAFDTNAAASNPVPGWIPGQSSPSGQALTFYNWYLAGLYNTVNWLQGVVRAQCPGARIVQLMPGQGVRPEQWNDFINSNLIPSGIYAGERGAVWDRILDGITDKDNLWINCSSTGDTSGSNEASTDKRNWSAAHWVAWNADRYGLGKLAENPGQTSHTDMQKTFTQMNNYGYQALTWAFGTQLHGGVYATLAQYAALIAANP